MVLRKLLINTKPLIPMILGLCVGLALSLVFGHLLEDSCNNISDSHNDIDEKESLQIGAIRKANAIGNEDFDYGNSDDFEPRIRVQDNSKIGKITPKTLLRPRYASTELEIRDKLFVGVLTSKNTIDSFGTAVNKTLTPYVPKLVFFTNSRGPVLPTGLSVVIFSNEEAKLVPFHMIKYIADHYIKNYDWFYFVTDHTYVRGEKLMDFVDNVSVSQDVTIGKSWTSPNSNDVIVDVAGGVLLSQNVLNAAINDLNWCHMNAVTDNIRFNLGQCLLHASKQYPVEKINDMLYSSYDLEEGGFEKNFPHLKDQQSFQNAITVQHVPDDTTIYKLHRYFCELELNITTAEIEKTREDIISLAPQTPGGEEALTWPIGIDPHSKEKNRFDVLQWQYFTESDIYLHSELHNGKKLSGVDKADVQEVLKISVEKLNEKYHTKYTLLNLLNGYRRFDPGRGMEYILDLNLRIKGSKEDLVKRVHLLRPLSFVEIVPMPYVTESSRVNLILPVKVEDRDDVVSFLDSYASTCLDSGDNTHLYVVFLYNDANPMVNGDEDSFSVLKSMMSFYESKYQNGARIAWTALHHNHPTQFTVMDAISKKFSKETLFLLCSVGMELSIEFLNRVRMNTIANWQVFFPIAFWQYKPSVVYDKHPYPTEIKISSQTGHFDPNMLIHSSFYNSDYHYARKQMIATSASQNMDLYDLFLKFHSIHVFRAVEPALKMRYRELQCAGSIYPAECEASRDEGLASRQRLAMLIFEHQNSLDEEQMQVMQQQNDPKLDQMKANMLNKK